MEVRPTERTGVFHRLRRGLSKTHQGLVGHLDSLFSGRGAIDQDLLDELEEFLITADLGIRTASRLLEAIQDRTKSKDCDSPEKVKEVIQREILEILKAGERPVHIDQKPFVFMVVGVNGVGKTATIGKLAKYYQNGVERIIFAAADTFRAAAIEQLEIWAHRAGAQLIKHHRGADPSAVAYDAVHASRARSADLLFIDTAGRLHTQVNLMEELKKIKRIVRREMPQAPHEVLLVLDATTGQNAIAQARLFHEALEVTGIALTKLDGTAKGGIIVAICQELGIPIHYVGVGEHLDDLHPFNAEQFIQALFA
ncbi:MAG: signal recognition particle-docking protein FtsY [Proteobacteria bacterium]|nr:signal recognition particle-docking protein FtsY [Pseudomonadota bacterium]NIS70040.1 signal recognition particle-docking protein FtsY [Pseudomonadota bacterium]